MDQTDQDCRQALRAAWPFTNTPLKRVVVKVGSNVLALPKGGLNQERIAELTSTIADAVKAGIEVILVTSGAVAAGRGLLGLTKRPTALPDLQAVAAIGQCALMEVYARAFREHGLIAAQLLLNRDDMDERRRYLNARNALISFLSATPSPSSTRTTRSTWRNSSSATTTCCRPWWRPRWMPTCWWC
jgi:hypothetical protein